MIEASAVFQLDTMFIPATLTYDETMPFEVKIQFHINGGGERWLFAREILILGVVEHAGMGDVKAWPTDDKFNLTVESPTGKAHVTTPLKFMQEYVQRIVDAVPLGKEVMDIDKELQSLMEG